MDIYSSSNICSVYDEFDFSKIILTHPESLQGGSFFTKLNMNNDMLYLQTPKCISKQGIVASSGKKTYIDLMFSADDSKFIEFMENLEKSCVEKIHDKKNSWFTNDIDINDIENAFAATLRPFKAGKYYLLRANIAPSKNLVKLPTCFVFDESEKRLTIEDIKPENDLITVLEIRGIKFTDKSFQFEIILRQVLIMENKPVFQSCVIKKNLSVSKTIHQTPALLSSSAEDNHHENTMQDNSKISNEDFNESQSQSGPDPEHQPNPAPQPQPHIENNLEKIQFAKNKNDGEDNEDNDNDDNDDDNDDTKNSHNNDPVSGGDNKSYKNNKSQVKISPPSESKKTINNLEKIQSLELNELSEITEADLEIKNDENIILKKPNDIYYEIYTAAKEKARLARKIAFDAYLEVKKIKKTYMLDDSDSDFSNSSSSSSESDSESESNSHSESSDDNS
jgi:hypothetical protein